MLAMQKELLDKDNTIKALKTLLASKDTEIELLVSALSSKNHSPTAGEPIRLQSLTGEYKVGTLGHLHQKLTELLQENVNHLDSLVVLGSGNQILTHIKTVQCFADTLGEYLTHNCYNTQFPSQKSNIIQFTSRQQFTLRDHYGLKGNNFSDKFITFEKIKDLTFSEAEKVLQDCDFADPKNRFCFSKEDGWIQEADLITDKFTAVDIREMLTPSTKNIMLFCTDYTWSEIKEYLSISKGEMARMLLKIKNH